MVLAGSTALSDRLSLYEEQRIYDFEQCANQCQIQQDEDAFLCLKQDLADENEDESESESEAGPFSDCHLNTQRALERCLSACPANPREELK